MSEPLKKPDYTPEGYDPREVPEIVRIAQAARDRTEKCIDTFTFGGAVFEVIERPDVLWVGTLAWAIGDDGPDGGALLNQYRKMIELAPKQALTNPDWSAGISISYRRGNAGPWTGGLMYAQETDSAQQDSRYDLFTQPAGLYIRLRKNDKQAKELLGKKSYEMEDLYVFMEDVASRHGYRRTEGNPIGIYYHDHQNHTGEYAYISIERKTPEGYDPRAVPEIVRMAQEAHGKSIESSAAQGLSSSGGNGIVSVIRPLIHDHYGENYWFNGCAAYAMECLGRPELDYWFFGGLTGDIFTQFYALKEKYNACAVSDIFMGPQYARWVFDQVGYACEYVTEQELLANKEHYLQKLMESIDRGVPVICLNWGVFVGYEDGGRTLLYITHEMETPGRLTVLPAQEGLAPERFIEEREFFYTDERKMHFDGVGLIFVGEKLREVPLAQLYREAILRLPALLNTQMDDFRFGAQAFRAFADDIERGKFDDPALLRDDIWGQYTNYVCVLATNGSCCFSFLEKALELNPDMTWLEKVRRQYKIMGMLWIGHEGKNKEQLRFLKEYKKQHGSVTTLEKLGGGFNVKYKTLQSKRKRAKIVAKIREFADCADEVVRLLGEACIV